LKGVSADRIGVIAGDLQDAESMKAALDLFGGLGVKNLDCRQDGGKLGYGAREGWLFNSTIAGIEQADAPLIVGSNVGKEAPLLNARIRKSWLHGSLNIAVVGEDADLTYPYERLGDGPGALKDVLRSKFGKAFKAAQRPAIIVGQGALARPDGAAVL